MKLSTWVREVARMCSCPWLMLPSERQDSSGPKEEHCREVRGGEKMLTATSDHVEGQGHVANGEGTGTGDNTLDLVVLLKEPNNNNNNNTSNNNNKHQQQ